MLHHIPRPFGLWIFSWWAMQDCKGRIFSAIVTYAATGIPAFGLMKG